jgi:hypothetical protein
MYRKRRSFNQVKEEISYRVLRQKLPEAWVMHEYGPDYGIDCVVELFDYIDTDKLIAETLGETFYVQLKASDSIEYSIKRAFRRANVTKGRLNEDKSEYIDIEVAKFQLELSELLTVQAMGPAVPVLLVLVDIQTERAFFVCLNDYLDKIIIPEDPGYASKDSKVIYLPTMNEIAPSQTALVPLRVFGKRAKMYGAFGKFTYQKKEIERIRGIANFNPATPTDAELDMLRLFIDTALRQDIWNGHEFWEPIGWSHRELQKIRETINAGIETKDHETFKAYCDDIVWHRLCNLANMYEELVREWFLPTVLAQLTSYPKMGEVQKSEV